MQIRPASEGDALAIAHVHVGSWQAAYRGTFPDSYLDTLDVVARERSWAETLRESLSLRARTLVGCTADGTVVGFAHVAPARDTDTPAETTGEITSIYVSPDVWGAGFGHRLLTAAVAVLGDAGYTEATLWVLDQNGRARRFYERANWSTDGAAKTVVIADTPITEVRYRRPLGNHPRP